MFLPPLKKPPIIHSKPLPNPLPNHISRHHNYEFHILYRAVFNHFPSRDIVRIRSIHINSKKKQIYINYFTLVVLLGSAMISHMTPNDQSLFCKSTISPLSFINLTDNF